MIIQVLKTKVLKCDPEKMKMMLSFKAAVEGVTEANVKPPVECEVGKVSTGLFVARSFFFFFFFNINYSNQTFEEMYSKVHLTNV